MISLIRLFVCISIFYCILHSNLQLHHKLCHRHTYTHNNQPTQTTSLEGISIVVHRTEHRLVQGRRGGGLGQEEEIHQPANDSHAT